MPKKRERIRIRDATRWERVLTMEQLQAVAAAKMAKDTPFVTIKVGKNYYNGINEMVTVAANNGRETYDS
jgi:hypothetical protein